MTLSDIVNVTITKQTQSPTQAGFGTLMVLGTFKNWNDLIRSYSNMNQVQADFSPSQPEYIAAQDFFSQTTTPPTLLIGRRAVDTVTVTVETTMPEIYYTTTINNTTVNVLSTTNVQDSTITLSGIITDVITFTTDFNSGTTAITPTVNGVQLASTAWTTDQPTTIAAVATVISGAAGVTSATASGDQITVVFASSSTAQVNGVSVVGTGSQPTASVATSGPLVTGNLINVSLNGTKLGTITSKVVFSTAFTAGTSTVVTVNSVALSAVLFNTDNATTLTDIATQISLASGVASATSNGTDTITVVFSAPGNNTVNSAVTTGGSAPTATISEGGFTFTTDSPTTMGLISAAIVTALNTGNPYTLATAAVSGVNNNIITIVSNPNQAGVINSFVVTLGASQSTAAIVNTLQPTSNLTIANAIFNAINALTVSLGVHATDNLNGSYNITANTAGVPYTISTNIYTSITPDLIPVNAVNRALITVTQAIPLQTYTLTIAGIPYSYIAPQNVGTNDQISLGLVAAINAGSTTVTAVDNGDGSFQVISNDLSKNYVYQVSPNNAMTIQIGLIINPYVNSQTIVNDLIAIQAVNNDWYALATIDRNSSDVQAVSAWIQSQIKIYGTSSNDPQIINLAPGENLSIAGILNNLNATRTFVLYHQDADSDYPEVAWFSAVLWTTPGSETWAFKNLVSIPETTLTNTQQNNVFGKAANTYQFIGGKGITQQGTVSGNEYIDIIRGIDWLTATIQSNVFNLLTNANTSKLPYTNAGITAVQSEIQQALQQGVDNNFLSSDVAYKVTVPNSTSVSSADKAARTLNNVFFQATLAGAIQMINIRGTLTV